MHKTPPTSRTPSERVRPRTPRCTRLIAVAVALLLWSARLAAAAPSNAPWSVDNPPGPSHEVSIDTDEGTWLSLDVSPDGRWVVFDLLGDIYEIPVSGGEARALTQGVAWDMQPRYSPDGRSIAFTSDRGGGDNIWIMARDGSGARAVTKERFRLLNSPAWSPDGQFIAARKHFTAHRSLGAGEIWLYHVSGGSGVQLTKRPNDQKDSGEPAFSPDGRFVYYSQDVTPGGTFEYNKDVNGEIYVVQRLDRQTGDIERFISGPGGAIRPTPSPNGRWLAFVRRVRGRSVLFVHDLRTGADRALWDGLERDMQETWAIHGVYPAFAWSPDSRALVLWAGGRFHRVDAERGTRVAIPFHVKATRRVSEAVRFPVDVAPVRFTARMLRGVRVSPNGRQAVFNAVGQVWVCDLPQGTPRRLTPAGSFAYFPSFSPDGRQVVYVAWTDDGLGRICVTPTAGGASRVVVSEPGHYLDPCFSPDGRLIVYRKTRGGLLTAPTHGHDPGIYLVAADGGAPRRVTRDGESPQFAAGSDRLYVQRDGPEDALELTSMTLSGADERTEVTCRDAQDIRISPDGRQVAFVQGFNVFVAARPLSGKPLQIDAKTDAVPVAQVSRDAGTDVHWSADGQGLYWVLGNQLFRVALDNVLPGVRGATGPRASDPTEATRAQTLTLQVTADVPNGSVAFVGARVITMRADEVLENATVVVQGNRISAVGVGLAPPTGAHVVDARGKTLIPGLIDVHWHGSQAENGVIPQRNWYNLAALAFGVTTIHDPSNNTAAIFSAREMGAAGHIPAPRIFSTGTVLYGAAGTIKAEVDSLDDARRHLRRMKAVGAVTVKSYNQPRRDQRQQIIAAARELEMMVVPEGGSLLEHNLNQVVDGHTGIEHALPVERVYKDVVQMWSGTAVGYTPTLVVGYGGIMGENYWYAHTNVWENERLARFVPQPTLDARSRRRVIAPEEEYNHIAIAREARRLNDAGVGVQLGAHGQREGLGAHWELWMLVQGGMSPMQALRVGTLNGARYLGFDRDLGSIEAGKLADIVVLSANPLDNIRDSEKIDMVMANGRLYDARTMNEIGNHARPRGRLFWER